MSGFAWQFHQLLSAIKVLEKKGDLNLMNGRKTSFRLLYPAPLLWKSKTAKIAALVSLSIKESHSISVDEKNRNRP
jgi:hypothetical protein